MHGAAYVIQVFTISTQPLFNRLIYKSFLNAAQRCAAWHDYEMSVVPYDKDCPIYYEFTACPIAEFAAKHDLREVMPDLCNPDYTVKALLHATECERHFYEEQLYNYCLSRDYTGFSARAETLNAVFDARLSQLRGEHAWQFYQRVRDYIDTHHWE